MSRYHRSISVDPWKEMRHYFLDLEECLPFLVGKMSRVDDAHSACGGQAEASCIPSVGIYVLRSAG
jgi:hypothetical protein